MADSQIKPVLHEDDEKLPFRRGADGEYDDIRGKDRDEVMLMHDKMINDQE
jgi:hypothetical protein